MSLDETLLSHKCDLTKFQVLGSTQLSRLVGTTISKLAPAHQAPGNQQAVLVALTAKARVASKLISIVEIAKRELAAQGVQVFQYNALGSEMIEMERGAEDADQPAIGAGDESDDAFETMGARRGDSRKKRLIPTMTVYLSTTSISALKGVYEEQK